MLGIFSVVLVFAFFGLSWGLPMLMIDGFSWAENLAFDGLGGLFVSESVRGELWRIFYDESKDMYNSSIHISKGFKQFGGLAPTADGNTLFAAAVNDKKENVIISTSTSISPHGEKDYTIVASGLQSLPNGMALVASEKALFCTSEKGTLVKVDIESGLQTVISIDLDKPDGLWFDQNSGKLFVGELVTKRMKVYDIATDTFSEYFSFGSNLGKLHLVDDFTTVGNVDSTNLGATTIVAADWTGRNVVELTLNGELVKSIAPPSGIKYFEPTSIRRGKGRGFDSNSFYITEGGGLTRNVHNRRVLQLVPGSVE